MYVDSPYISLFFIGKHETDAANFVPMLYVCGSRSRDRLGALYHRCALYVYIHVLNSCKENNYLNVDYNDLSVVLTTYHGSSGHLFSGMVWAQIFGTTNSCMYVCISNELIFNFLGVTWLHIMIW